MLPSRTHQRKAILAGVVVSPGELILVVTHRLRCMPSSIHEEFNLRRRPPPRIASSRTSLTYCRCQIRTAGHCQTSDVELEWSVKRMIIPCGAVPGVIPSPFATCVRDYVSALRDCNEWKHLIILIV